MDEGAEPSPNGVAVNVVERVAQHRIRNHVAIMPSAGLPKPVALFAVCRGQVEALRIGWPRFVEVAQNPVRRRLLDGPQNLRHLAPGHGLEQQMDMLGHHHIGEEFEPQFLARSGERLQEELSTPAVLKRGNSAVHAEGEQMQMSIHINCLTLFQLHNLILGFSSVCCKMEGCGV